MLVEFYIFYWLIFQNQSVMELALLVTKKTQNLTTKQHSPYD